MLGSIALFYSPQVADWLFLESMPNSPYLTIMCAAPLFGIAIQDFLMLWNSEGDLKMGKADLFIRAQIVVSVVGLALVVLYSIFRTTALAIVQLVFFGVSLLSWFGVLFVVEKNKDEVLLSPIVTAKHVFQAPGVGSGLIVQEIRAELEQSESRAEESEAETKLRRTMRADPVSQEVENVMAAAQVKKRGKETPRLRRKQRRI